MIKLKSLPSQYELSIGNSGFKLSKILEAQNLTEKIFILKVILVESNFKKIKI